MNPLKKLQRQFRRLFSQSGAGNTDAAVRLDGPPAYPDGFDPLVATHIEQPADLHSWPSRGNLEDRAILTKIEAVPALKAVIGVPDSRHIVENMKQPPSRLKTHEPRKLEHPQRNEGAAIPLARIGQNTAGSSLGTGAPDPFSLVGLQNALPPFETPAAPVASSSHAGSARPAVPAPPGSGTYGNRNSEQRRLGITAYGKYECEHVVGYSVAHPNVPRNSTQGVQLANGMPAYYEPFQLHQEHAGSRENSRVLYPRLHGGWRNPDEYRRDQREALRDPVAKAEGTSASNAYQLNTLGYAHILDAEQNGLSRPSFIPDYLKQNTGRRVPELPTRYYMPGQAAKATDSFKHMVKHDPPITHRLNGKPETARLGPQGQAEALLAREAAMTGAWPSVQTIANAASEVLTPPQYQEKQDSWIAAGARLPDPAPPYRSRDRQQDRSISII